MLSVHTGIVASIDLVSDEGKVTRGRDCFSVFYTRLTKIYRENAQKANGKHSDENVLRLSYQLFWKKHQVELGHYFRYLYNVIRFIKESGFVEGPYLRLIRAQLSDQEALILFYNCIASEYGENFRDLAVEFALLNNMPKIRVLQSSHLSLIDASAFTKSAEL
ncbi:putative phage abortive infection protein [Achromobacter insolitus]|uniref:putative phage abortive infection protein n=1 Tax=Achromobacter insolitus TaxID=217204 RepID=UPI00366F0B09